jgi:hypothetical protein
MSTKRDQMAGNRACMMPQAPVPWTQAQGAGSRSTVRIEGAGDNAS